MNPAQFQNNGGMGRGIPNMQQMNNQGPLTPMNAGRYINQTLLAQGPFTGWQATVPIEQRMQQVKLLSDSLRLLRPVLDYGGVVNVAINFEHKAFLQHNSLDQYLANCHEKLERIRDQRQQQSNSADQVSQLGNMDPMQLQQMNPNMMFPPHSQGQMQPSPASNQQRAPQNMINPNQGMATGNPLQQGQAGQPGQQGTNLQNQLPLTVEDNKIINAMAAQMAQKVSPQEKAKITNHFSPEQRQQLAQQGWDPMHWFFRSQASKQFRRQKMAQMSGNAGLTAMPGNLNNAQLQGQSQNATGGQDPGFSQFPNLSRFQGQQADGLRSQEEGQLVVPASNSQGMTPEQYRLQQQMLVNSQRLGQQPAPPGMNANFLAQQQLLQQAQPDSQDKAQILAQYQAQSQAQARNQAAARAQMGLQGQAPGQGMPTPNNPAAMLNRTMGQNMQGNSPQVARPGSRPAVGMSQPGQQNQVASNKNGTDQQREAALSKFPPQLANVLRNKPTSEWSAIINQFRQQTAMRRSVSQQPSGSQTQQQGQVPQLPNGQFLGGSTMGPTPMQASLSAGPPGARAQDAGTAAQQMQDQQFQRQVAQNQEMMQQRQLQQQQQQQLLQQRSASGQQGTNGQRPGQPLPEMSPEDMAVMDRQPIPAKVSQSLQKVPGFSMAQLQNWGQLKQWLSRNPQPNVPMNVLLNFQKQQFAMAIQNRNAQMAQGSTQGTPVQMQPPQPAPGMPLAQPLQNNMVQNRPANMPMNFPAIFKPIDEQDIQRARALDARLANLPEVQLRTFLTNQRQKQFAQRMLQQQNAQAAQAPGQQISFMPVQTGQIQPPGQQSNPAMARQGSGAGVGPSNTAAQGQMPQMAPNMQRPPSTQNPQPMQRAQGQPVAVNKGVKRANDEDVIEVPNPATGAQQAPNRLVPSISKEQFESMTPQQKLGYTNIMKRQQASRTAHQRVVELTKQVQSTMQPLRPIKNMDNVDRDRIRKHLTSDDTKQMLSKFDQFIIAYQMMEHKEEDVKHLLNQKMHLVPQYVPQSYANRTFEPVKDFSVPLNYVEGTIKEMLAKYQQVLQKSAAQRQAQPQNAAPQVAQLTPENLGLLEAQEAQRRGQKGSKGKDVPPAPTTSQPPFQIGDPRGHGTPRYAQPGLKQEDLKLDPKRRKKNPPTIATTPVTDQAATAQPKSPQLAKEQKVPLNAFRCPVPSCDHNLKGFATQAELTDHNASAHKPAVEYIADPIAFLEEETRKALDLDLDGMPRKKMEQTATQPMKAPLMQKTISKASASSNLNIKQEKDSKPSTPAMMARGASQIGKISPAAARATQPSSALRTGVKTEVDSWTNSNISLSTLRDNFGVIDMGDVVPSIARGAGDGEGIGMDLEAMMEEYMQTDSWTRIQPQALEVLSDASDKSKSPAVASEVLKIGEAKNKDEPTNQSSSDLLVDLELDGIDLGAAVPVNDADVDMADSWELPELGGDFMDEFEADRKDSDADSWEGWLKLDTTGGEPKVKDDDDRSDSPFEEIDWDSAFAEGKDLSILQGGAGPLARRTKGLAVGTK